MRRLHISPTNSAEPSVRSQNHHWSKLRFQRPVQICKALNIQHMDLIDEQHSRDQLSNSLIDVLAHDFVDFFPEFLGDLGFLGFHDGVHDGEEVLTSLGTGICGIEIV